MNRLACRLSELPPIFYRVQYDGCSTSRCDDGSFLAADTTAVYQDKDLAAFAQSVINQFIRYDRAPTPWITVFADREYADHFALQTNGPAKTYIVHSSRLRGARVFQIATLVRAFELQLPDGTTEHATHGYLILHRIPAEAVEEVEDMELAERVPVRDREIIMDPTESIDVDDSDDESVWDDDLVAILDRPRPKKGYKSLSLSGQYVEC